MVAGKRVEDDFEFIHNTVGIQDISEGLPGKMGYYWGTKDGKSVDFFPSEVKRHYITNLKWDFNWPTMGMILNDELFLYA
jgi:hypothetical protein